ncbi:MAG: type II secretion system F family protein, partial [Chloroflexi bacterium]|nr:type II secretion system F family protein [Chloroflexota bacterium]
RNMSKAVTRFAPQFDLEAIRLKLDIAGNPNNLSPNDFLGLRGLAAAAVGIIVFALMLLKGIPIVQVATLTIGAGGIGFYLPVLWINRKVRARQEGILDALPDALDLLTVSVEAGLTFEASMARLADKADNELTRSFARALTEIKMGRRRVDAMRDMAARSAVPELEYFVSALIQAEQLGVSTAKVLRIQADEMRIKRRQRAEEQAQKTPVKMSIVLVGLILPALFLVLLGPSVARACRQFGSNVPICK